MTPQKILKAKCPTCQTLTVIEKSNPHRPFCSARCKLIDLGEWASESYKIPGKETINPEDLLKDDEDKE